MSHKVDLNARNIDTKEHFIKMKKVQSTGNTLIVWTQNTLFFKKEHQTKRNKPQTILDILTYFLVEQKTSKEHLKCSLFQECKCFTIC